MRKEVQDWWKQVEKDQVKTFKMFIASLALEGISSVILLAGAITLLKVEILASSRFLLSDKSSSTWESYFS